MSAKVEYMQKILLSVQTDNVSGPESVTESIPTIEFVYGLSSTGLTPFEFALAEKTVGDEVRLQLSRNQIPEYFGHIRAPALHVAGESDSIVLTVRVLKISPASSREVVKTLADIANCGDSCCGRH